MPKEKFSKPFATYPEQLAILQKRGLIVSDAKEAESFLAYSNYYRFSGYLLAFEDARHVLVPNTTFENVRRLYEFDRILRCLVSEAIAEIEMSVRSRIAHELRISNDPFFHRNSAFFQPQRYKNWCEWYDKIIKETERSQEPFVKHFETKYEEYPDLPIWVLIELISFGSLSQLYACLLPKYQKAVSKCFCLPHIVLVSWLHTLTHIRNLCAHHARLWDRHLGISPTMPDHSPEWNCLREEKIARRTFCMLSIIKFFLDKIKGHTNVEIGWSKRIMELLERHPDVPNFEKHFGMPNQWHQMSLWQR